MRFRRTVEERGLRLPGGVQDSEIVHLEAPPSRALIDTTISRDVLLMTRVDKPALL
jgi:hypothetical protein